MGKEQDGLNSGGSSKQKQPPKDMANFFMPISKRTKVAAELVVDAKKEEMPAREEPNVSMLLGTILDRKSGKMKAKKGDIKPQEPEGSLSQPDVEFGGSQPAILSEQKRENESPAKEKKQSRPSPAKKKRKSGGLETKPMVGVHGSDLRLQARLAAEENARLSAGKAPHPFFARPKVGGARSLFGEEPSQIPEVRSVVQASNCSENTSQMSPVKTPHPPIVRPKLGSARSFGMDEVSNFFGNRSLVPCPPIHITQNNLEEEVEPVWSPRWTWQNVAERRCKHGKVEVKWHLGHCPLSRQKWPSLGGVTRWSRSISNNVALQQLVHYLLNSRSGSQHVLGEEVEFEVGYMKKLVERFSSHYSSYPRGTHFENNSPLHMVEGSEKDCSSTQNLLWTDRYQPQTSQEVCGNKDAVKSLNGWLQSWREKILSQKVTMKKAELEAGNDDDDDDDDESDFDESPSDIDDDSEGLHNCLVITGPVGCGKSAAIYACAMEQGFTVIEVNASECRNGALIKHKFKEAMESHGLSNRSSTVPVDTFDGEEDDEHVFKLAEVSGGSAFQEGMSQSQPVLSQGGSRNNPPPPALRRLRVILFEDVDTVFEEDAGFMGALGLLARTSKCPIIFSSNSQDPVLPQVRKLESIKFEQLCTVELVLHAFMVCMAEGVVCSPDIVEHIVKASGHDLRKLLMLLQFWSQGLPVGTENLDNDPVLEMKQGHRNHFPDLINCLLQLDGCPQVFATTTYESDQKPIFARCSSRAHEIPRESVNGIIEWGNSSSSSREGEPTRKIDEGILDPEWLFAYDSQHRVLPLLFLSSQPCQLAIQISEHLKGMGEKATELADITVATWERHRFNELQAKAEEATQARKALRKLKLAARKEEPTAFLTPGMDIAPHLHATGWVLPQRHFGLEVCANRRVLHLERLGVPLQQNVQIVAAENSSLLFPIFIPQERPVELGAVISRHADTLANKDQEQLNQNPTYLTVADNTKALDKKVETLPCVDTVASNFMKQVWVKLRELKLQDPLSDVSGESVLLEDVLHDLSTCDILSTRNMATTQESLTSVQQGNLVNQEHSYGGSRDSCTESAALLAQLRLNQALHQMTTSSSFSSEACQVHPPILQQESKRQEIQASKDELVDALLPQRCRMLDGVARLDYASFHSRMRPAADQGSVDRPGPSTRQRKLILFN